MKTIVQMVKEAARLGTLIRSGAVSPTSRAMTTTRYSDKVLDLINSKAGMKNKKKLLRGLGLTRGDLRTGRSSSKLLADAPRQAKRTPTIARTPETYAGGLERGNEGLLREHGFSADMIKEFKNPNRVAFGVQLNADAAGRTVVNAPKMVPRELEALHAPSFFPRPAGFDFANFGPQYRSSGILQQAKDARDAIILRTAVIPPSTVDSKALHGRLANRMLGDNPNTRSVINRHEIDEFGQMQKLFRRGAGDMNAGAIFTHMSPQVTLNEAKNVQGLGSEVIELIKRMRSEGALPGVGLTERQYLTRNFADQYPKNMQQSTGAVKDWFGALAKKYMGDHLADPMSRTLAGG